MMFMISGVAHYYYMMDKPHLNDDVIPNEKITPVPETQATKTTQSVKSVDESLPNRKWSELMVLLMQVEETRTEMMDILLKKSPPTVTQLIAFNNDDKSDATKKTQVTLSKNTLSTPRASPIRWANLGHLLFQLEQQRQQVVDILTPTPHQE